MSVRAKYEYAATADNQLSFAPGDTFVLVKKDASGWWTGEKDGKQGVFPGNRVDVLEEVKGDAGTAGDGGGGGGGVETCRAKYDYVPTGDGQLAFKAGATIVVVNKNVGAGWWQGTLDGTTGLFPENYVELQSSSSSSSSSAAAAAEGKAYVATFDFAADRAGVLSLKKDERVTVFSADGDWWKASNAAGEHGLVPGSYLRAADGSGGGGGGGEKKARSGAASKLQKQRQRKEDAKRADEKRDERSAHDESMRARHTAVEQRLYALQHNSEQLSSQVKLLCTQVDFLVPPSSS